MHRTDERDTMFARAHYTPGSEAYEDYYKRFPEKKNEVRQTAYRFYQ